MRRGLDLGDMLAIAPKLADNIGMDNVQIQIQKVYSLTSNMLLGAQSKEFTIEITEFDEERISFQIPKMVGTGLLISLEIVIVLANQNVPMKATGKIKSCEALSSHAYLVLVELHDFDAEVWSQFLLARAQEQNRVQKLLKDIKGEE